MSSTGGITSRGKAKATKSVSRSSKAGLQFPVGRIARYLKAGNEHALGVWRKGKGKEYGGEGEGGGGVRGVDRPGHHQHQVHHLRPPCQPRRLPPPRVQAALPGGRQGDQVGGLVSDGWTNDTYNMYISSMEASFMQQLCGQQQHHHHATPDRGMIHVGSGHGLKVLQEGASDTLGCKKNVPRPHDVGPRGLLEDPWASCFKPRDSAMNRRGDGVGASDGESGTDTVQVMAPKHGRGVSTCVRGNPIDRTSGCYTFHLVC
ncbi:unnamed protein product [Triticum turgidum subsp. durum]|uniref:Histone H2A n=2 Tax=Triticum TaxID=4564 RepID=A0A9R1QYN2_TRITD|nr:unnamed protein product [Triticum aestivum]VAH86098.1 unnamed protein product [Triticum turgidum subsp. durum]